MGLHLFAVMFRSEEQRHPSAISPQQTVIITSVLAQYCLNEFACIYCSMLHQIFISIYIFIYLLCNLFSFLLTTIHIAVYQPSTLDWLWVVSLLNTPVYKAKPEGKFTYSGAAASTTAPELHCVFCVFLLQNHHSLIRFYSEGFPNYNYWMKVIFIRVSCSLQTKVLISTL